MKAETSNTAKRMKVEKGCEFNPVASEVSNSIKYALGGRCEMKMGKVCTVLPTINSDILLRNKKIGKVTNEDFFHRWSLLMLYENNFTEECQAKLLFLEAIADATQSLKFSTMAVSKESIHSHLAWTNTPRHMNGIKDLAVPIISDFSMTLTNAFKQLLSSNMETADYYIISPDGMIRLCIEIVPKHQYDDIIFHEMLRVIHSTYESTLI